MYTQVLVYCHVNFRLAGPSDRAV